MKEGNELHGGDQGLNTEYTGYHWLDEYAMQALCLLVVTTAR